MACKCSDYKAAMLRSKIAIERNSTTEDGEGGFTDGWSEDPAGGVRAKVRAISGKEQMRYGRNVPSNMYDIVIRWRGDGNGAPYYGIADRIQYRGRELAITSVTDVEDKNRWLRIMAQENKPT